jgi:hypothetical protein
MYSKIVVVLIFATLLTACRSKPKETYNSKLAITNEIKEKTTISLDTAKFRVLIDSIHNTEEAFDSDYDWSVTIQFDANYIKQIKKDIQSSTYFNLVTYEYDDKWNTIDTAQVLGIWHEKANELEFIQKPKKYNPEPIQLTLDTVTRKLNLYIIHL